MSPIIKSARPSVLTLCLLSVAVAASTGVIIAENGLIRSRPTLRQASEFPESSTNNDPANPCAVVSAAMATHLLGAPVMLARVKESVNPDVLGRATMEDIVRGLEQLHFSALGVRLTPGAITHLRTPVILHVDGVHFVAAQVGDNGRIVIYDPPALPVAIAPELLTERWDGLAVLVTRNSRDLREALSALGMDPRILGKE